MIQINDRETRLYLDNLPVGICIISDDYIISLWNQTLAYWTGIKSESACNQLLFDIAHEFADPLIKERINIAFKGGGPILFSFRFHPHIFPRSIDDYYEGRFQRTTVIPLNLSDGQVMAMIVVEDVSRITDQITAYRNIQNLIVNELEEKKKAEATLAIANNKLNTLASINRHDLQNLLMAFEGYLTFALQKDPNDAVRLYLEKMQRVAEVMKKQVAFTRDYQDMGIRAPAWHNVSDLASSSIGTQAFEGVELVCSTGALKILADPLILKAMYNLIENSVRHGEHTTRIDVSAEIKDNEAILVIQDNGKGIADNIKKRIFDRGFGSNTGLGLFLTKEILAITGITIIENGKEGVGARFELHIPAGFYKE